VGYRAPWRRAKDLNRARARPVPGPCPRRPKHALTLRVIERPSIRASPARLAEGWRQGWRLGRRHRPCDVAASTGSAASLTWRVASTRGGGDV
jgi:hypothetical protein